MCAFKCEEERARARAPYARQGLDSVCEWQWSWPGLGALFANEMAACLHQQQPRPQPQPQPRHRPFTQTQWIFEEAKSRERKKPKQKRNETKQNETFATAPFGATKDVFPLKAFAGKSCLNLATDTCVCSGWGSDGEEGEPEEKPYWKQCAINNNINISSTIIIICVLWGLSSFFGHATQLQMILPTKTPSSMICGAQLKSKKQEEVWQQKC